MNNPPARVRRRTVVAGMAWTAPAVVAVTAAPSYAVSNPPVYPQIDYGASCKLSGQSCTPSFGYIMTLCFVNTTNQAATVTVTSFSMTGASVAPSLVNEQFDIGPAVGGSTRTCKTYTVTSTNSAQRYATIGYVVGYADGSSSSESFTIDFDGFKPCKNCAP